MDQEKRNGGIDGLLSNREAAVERIIASTSLSDDHILKTALEGVHPADIAKAVRYLEPEDQERVIGLLTPEESSEVLLALRDVDEEAAIKLAKEIDNDELSEMLDVMEPDDATDVIADLPEEDAAAVLELMEEEGAESVQELLKYPEETAGGIMTSEFTALREDMTTDEALQYLRENPPGRQIFYIYVIDDEDRFLGTVSLDRLITEGPNVKLGDVTVPNIVSVQPETDREEAVALVVNGFVRDVLQQLPMEFMAETQKLIGISLEGSVG